MPRFKLTIEYAGTRYSGWQIQKNARTVQGEIDRAARLVTKRTDFELYGAGRTDAGVHALAQVAHLDVATNLPADTLRRRLNDELPADINILDAVIVPHRFHARHDASARRYLYQIARRRTAFAKPFVWWVKEPLDVARMRAASSAFTGMRDFQSFAERDEGPSNPPAGGRSSSRAADPSAASRTKSTRVLIERVEIVEAGALILVAIEGSHFLWKMVRRIVGVLVEIGTGEMGVDAAERLLASDTDVPARLTAPAAGLFLERVYYTGEPRSTQARPASDIWTLEC